MSSERLSWSLKSGRPDLKLNEMDLKRFDQEKLHASRIMPKSDAKSMQSLIGLSKIWAPASQ